METDVVLLWPFPINVSKATINLPYSDGLYYPFMAKLGTVYHWIIVLPASNAKNTLAVPSVRSPRHPRDSWPSCQRAPAWGWSSFAKGCYHTSAPVDDWSILWTNNTCKFGKATNKSTRWWSSIYIYMTIPLMSGKIVGSLVLSLQHYPECRYTYAGVCSFRFQSERSTLIFTYSKIYGTETLCGKWGSHEKHNFGDS